MNQTLAVDYSFARPDPAAIKAAGYTAVGRYITGNGKALTADEAKALHAAGLDIWLVFETVANRATAGKRAGANDARTAQAAAAALGYPTDAPLFFAVDFDGTRAQVADYFAGVRSVLGDRAGIYGGIKLMGHGLAAYEWQTAAWSGGKVAPTAHIYQRISHSHSIKGSPANAWDENVLCHPFPLWGNPAPAPKPKPAPKPTRKPSPAPKPPTPAPVPTAVERARVHLEAALADLDHAVKNGRKGWVRIARSLVRRALAVLPKR